MAECLQNLAKFLPIPKVAHLPALGMCNVDNFASIVPKIIAFTQLCNLKILLDFQASLRFLPSPYDWDRSGRSLELIKIKLTTQKAQISPKRDKITNLDFEVAEPCKCDDSWHDTSKIIDFGRRATFGSGRNSAKFWRHSAMSGHGSCMPCLFIL